MAGKASIGNLDDLIRNPVSSNPWDDFSHLQNPNGSWKVRDDVTLAFNNDINQLTVGKGTNGANFGPELEFGQVVGDYFDEPVLIIKAAQGGTDLAVDWRPISSGIPPVAYGCGPRLCDSRDYGKLFNEMISYTNNLLGNLPTKLPQFAGFDPIISGFVWFQGYNGEF